MINEKKNFWTGVGWVGCYLQRFLSAQVNGGSRGQHWPRKKSVSAVRASGGFPGNGPMLWLSKSPMTLTLDFQGQILKMLYLRNGRADWHGMKGMWVDRMLHPLCDFQLWPQPWPWISTVKFWKSCISEMGWPIDMERKGCGSIECWAHVVTFNVHLFHDLDLGFSRSNLEKVISQEWDGRLTWNERDVGR